jgi:hypothetical protein
MRSSLFLFALAASSTAAAQDHVLFVDFGGSYSAVDGVNMHAELLLLDPNAVYVNIRSNPGGAAAAIAGDTFDQVWVYDLSTGADAYQADFAAIDTWWRASGGEVIADGRFLSSFWNGRAQGEGRLVTQNYYTNLMNEGGGIVLATDHNTFSNAGINQLNALLGINPFIGNIGGSFPVDSANPLMSTPNVITGLFNDSSTGQAPFGLQPNGLILDAVGYHSGNTATPGISSTIDGSLNLVVTIDEPVDGSDVCLQDQIPATVSATGNSGTVNYSWESDVDGPLGTGASITLDGATLTPGPHEIRVIGDDSVNIDDADIEILVRGPNCDDDGDGVNNGTDTCEGFDDTADADVDGVPDGCDVCDGDDATGDSDGDGICDDLDFTLDITDVVVVGDAVEFTIRNAPPGAPVVVMGSCFGTGVGPCAPGGFLCVELLSPALLLTGTADANGEFTSTVVAPPSVGRAGTVWFQAIHYDASFMGEITDIEERTAIFP